MPRLDFCVTGMGDRKDWSDDRIVDRCGVEASMDDLSAISALMAWSLGLGKVGGHASEG